MRKFAVYVGDDVYLFDNREEAEAYAETKRREETQSVKVEAEADPDKEVSR